MNSSGRTPLLRAKKIEAMFGVGEVYLKLEGTNPYGHKFDRIAEIIVKDAEAGGYTEILVDGPRSYLRSVKAFADDRRLRVLIPLFKGQSWKNQIVSSERVIDLKKTRPEEVPGALERLCDERACYNGATGYYNTHLSILALEEIGQELVERLGEISSVFVQLSYGYTVSSLYNAFFRGWVQGDLEHYPQIYSCTIPKGNRIYEDWKLRNEIPDIDEYDLKITKYTKDLYIENTALLEETLKAIRDTDGEIITIDEKTLKEAASILRTVEHVNATPEEAYAFAGFYKQAQAGKLGTGRHVVILNNGKSDIDVERLEDFSTYPADYILSLVDSFLMDYADPHHEMRDAIHHAMNNGAIFLATMNGEVQGLTVVVHTGFEEFIPTYHLAYIGTRSGRKGRGIASTLIDEVITFTEGNVSLHVDLDNNRAKKLYEKFGFKHKYNRMIYVGETS